jgi:hypothetical protein
VTIILGGDSLIHKNKNPEIKFPAPGRVCHDAALMRGCNRMATPLGTLGLGLVIFLLMLCFVVFLFAMNKTLFKSFSMRLYILSCMVYWIWVRSYGIMSCIIFIIIIFLMAHTLNFKLSRGLATCLMT